MNAPTTPGPVLTVYGYSDSLDFSPPRDQVEAVHHVLADVGRYLRPRDLRRGFINSYTLKHIAERVASAEGRALYVGSGAAIQAAMERGFEVRRIERTPNARITLPATRREG